MRHGSGLLTMVVMLGCGTPAFGQGVGGAPEQGRPGKVNCDTFRGSDRDKCLQRAEQQSSGGASGKDAKLINGTNTAAQAKSQAGDFAGAAALYDEALTKAGKDTPKQYLLVGKAIAQRRQAIAAYNAVAKPVYPPPGSGNEAIRAANAANAALQTQRVAAALPLVKTALATAAEAATVADGQKDKNVDGTIGVELREDAELLYKLDPAAVVAAPRPSVALEVAWLRKWMGGTPAPTAADLGRSGFPVAAAELARDRTAGLALADELQAKTGGDLDSTLAYAEIVAAAKLPAADPRRVKTTAAITAIETGGTTNDAQKARVRQVKAALAAPK